MSSSPKYEPVWTSINFKIVLELLKILCLDFLSILGCSDEVRSFKDLSLVLFISLDLVKLNCFSVTK